MVRIAYLVEKWGEPWNEGYKNLARYTYRLLKNVPGVSINILSEGEVELSKLINYDLIWVFNYPETPLTMLHFILSKINIKSPIVKFVAKKELDVNFKERVKTMLYRNNMWDVIVTTTDLLKFEVMQYFRLKKIFTLPPPIPDDYFYPMKKSFARRTLGLRDDLLYIGYSGKVNRYVKLDLLVESLKGSSSYRNVILLLAISSFRTKIDLERLLQALERVGVSVKLVHVRDIRMLYSAVDLLVYPVERKGAIEPPLTLLEAMSCGTPIAALKNTATEVFIRNRCNGFIFESPSELRVIIDELSNNSRLFRIISEQARRTILESFSFPKLIKVYINFISGLVNLS